MEAALTVSILGAWIYHPPLGPSLSSGFGLTADNLLVPQVVAARPRIRRGTPMTVRYRLPVERDNGKKSI
jgi:hypothetical protein